MITADDGESQVCLQRTCRAAYKLNPGLILAPLWHTLWTPSHPIVQKALVDMLRAITRANLFKQSWFPPIVSLRYLGDDRAHPYEVYVAWFLSPDISGYLTYIPKAIEETQRWNFSIALNRPIPMTTSTPVLQVDSSTLAALLMKAPTLCFGASPELLKWHVATNDLEPLFVHRTFRTK